jgi:uncharacterized protein
MVHSPYQLALGAITLVAAFVNGALGYGFSSITVPLALLFVTNRALNPALVPIEVLLNAHVLWTNRAALPHVWRRVATVAAGLVPGIALGTLIVARVASGPLKLATFAALLPLILMQAAGYRRPVRAERSAGALFGAGVGLLYASTTISGPPLALALNNQGFSKEEFRAALGFVRLVESSVTAGAYLAAGLFAAPSVALMPIILPGVVLGVPLGVRAIRHLPAETFRRVCMSFDAWVVAFGISLLLRDLHLVESASAYLVLIVVMLIDGWLLHRFFSAVRRAEAIYAA